MRTRLLIFILLAMFWTPLSFLAQNQGRPKSTAAPLIYTSAPQYDPLAWLNGGERFPRGATVFVKSNAPAKPLVNDFFATADANVSFDAASVLFSAKQHSQDHWQVWELAFSSEAPRQVTHCDDDCIKPLYIPRDRVVYAHKISGHFVLEIAMLATGTSQQLTHAPGNSIASDILQDGRILFASGEPLGDGTTAELYTIYTDGSGVESYRCDHGHSRHSGKQLASGDVVFVRDGDLSRFTSAVAHEMPVGAPRAAYAGDVIESSRQTWIVSSRMASAKYYDLRTWNPGAPTLLPLARDAKANLVQPALLAPRAVPNRHPSALHEWTYANILCLNAYTSKPDIAQGSIAAVRLYTRDSFGASHAQGTTPVERDGSFYLRVPGDTPLRIELLDASGKPVKSEAGWFWLRSGEQRICVGCHAGPERAPENIVPLVLQRSTLAADFTNAHSSQAPAAGGH